MKGKASMNGQLWRVSLLLLMCLLGGSSGLYASSKFKESGYTKVVDSPSLSAPYFHVRTLFYDCYSYDSFFTHAQTEPGHDGPALYIDGHWLCSPDWELAWPGSDGRGSDGRVYDECRENDEWWGNTYTSPVIDGVTYTIKFWNPVCKDDDSRYVDIYIFPNKTLVNQKHTITLKGLWVINGSKNTYSYQQTDSYDFKFNGYSMNLNNPTGVMSEYGKFKVSGSLLSGHGATTILTSDNPNTSLCVDQGNNTYTASCGQNDVAYSNKELTWGNRQNYFTAETKYVELAFTDKITLNKYSQDIRQYQWFPVSVPGYLRVKDTPSVNPHNDWTKEVMLEWDTEGQNNGGKWTIYRYKTSAGASTRVAVETGLDYSTKSKAVTVDNYREQYTFDVVFIPNNGEPRKELTKSASYTLEPKWEFSSITAAVSETDVNKINITWKHPPLVDAGGSHPYTFYILRSEDRKNWTQIKTLTVTTSDEATTSYLDEDNLNANHVYYYKLKVNVFGQDKYSNEASIKLGGTKIIDFSASRGNFSTMVKLQWTVKQVGVSNTNYDIYRRPLGSNDDWGAPIATLSGTASGYSYDDTMSQPGSFYEYKLVVWSQDGDKKSPDDFRTTDGFSVTTGIISGDITYGTGSAVEGVKVTLKQQNANGEITSGMHSLRLKNSTKSGLVYDTDETEIQKLFASDFSVQMYVNPVANEMAAVGSRYFLFDVYNVFTIYLNRNDDASYTICGWINATYGNSKITIPSNQWSQITVVHSHEKAYTAISVTRADSVTLNDTILNDMQINWTDKAKTAKEIGIANSASMAANTNFRGYIDEFRFFTKALSGTEIERNFNHPLAGNESGLAIYYPMDEGLQPQQLAYDFSKSNGNPNGRHATTRTDAESSSFVPSEYQLSLMAYTDSLGYYEVRGVPFSGEGISYSVNPRLGIHEFSPASRSRFVSINSLIHNSVDFEDISSFPVSGTVVYSGTTYPVEGVSFTVDGVSCAKDGKLVTSNEQGEFTISVPIGKHFITASKSGHVFANGRYPADPDSTGTERIEFDHELKGLEFRDTTLVNFTGRVVGGKIESDKTLGFGLSKNNLGRVQFILTPTNETPYMNAVKNQPNADIVAIPSATDAVNSKSWRGANIDDCKKLFIQTDSLTGEFSALVPPLMYKVSTMNVVNGGMEVGGSTTVDLTNPNHIFSDTLYTNNDDYELYTYHTALIQAYPADPTFNVVQDEHDDGSFGIDDYKYKDAMTEVKINDIHHVDTNGDVVYTYGHPLFVEGEPYTFNIEAYQEFQNADNNIIDRVPLSDVVVTINNALSDDQSVFTVSGDVTFEDGATATATAGEVYDLKSNQLKLDSLGRATYTWHAGLPNVASPFTRSISMSYDLNDRTYTWPGTISGVIIGDLPTGNNFVTAGPDKLTMILRDPPGTGSSAEWTSGTVKSISKTKNNTWSDSFDGGTTWKLGLALETVTGSVVGVPGVQSVVAASVKEETKDDLTTHVVMENEGEKGETCVNTTTITQTYATSGEPDFVGADGDVFIGQATNIVFGNARHVGFKKTDNSGSTFEIGLNDVITTGLKFGTIFSYTQNYIENYLIPNFIKLRNTMLTTVTQAEIDKYNPEDNVGLHNKGKNFGNLYLTTLLESDPDFGEPNTYTVIIPKIEDKNMPDSVKTNKQRLQWCIQEGLCAEDSVKWVNSQIKTWEKNLAFNEMEKVRAFQYREDKDKCKTENYSFDGGTSYTYSIEKEHEKTSSWDWTVSAGALIGNHFGHDFSGWGLEVDIEVTAMGGRHEAKDSTNVDFNGFSYTFAEEAGDALSVDVYEYGAFSPIFRTRAGQTSNPYEGEVRTTYFEDGGTHPVIMEATMQIEVPQIDVYEDTRSDLPTGSAANYTLYLSNASEIGEDVAYKLFVLDETNPDGAQLSIDGKVLTEGRLIKVPGNQTLTKTLQLRQTDTSILEYMGNKDVDNELYQKGIGIVFASDSQPEDIADTVFIFAKFVPSSSNVDLALSNTIMNTQTGTDLALTFSNFDRNYHNLEAFRLQYKKQGATDWTLLREYVLHATPPLRANQEELPKTGSKVTYMLPMASFSDGKYLFRCESASTYGNEEVYRYSDEILLTKDMQRPRPLGQPEPSDGILDIGDDLSVTFNEEILKGELSKLNNFSVTGVLNGATIAHETALAMQNTDGTAETEVDINLANKDFSIDTWMNINGAGTLLSHGTAANKLIVRTDESNHLVVDIAGTTYTSNATLPQNTWSFLTLCYKTTANGGSLSASVASSSDEAVLFTDKNVVKYEGNGPLTVGKQMTGAIHELLLWDEAHDLTTALVNRSKTKNPATRHLIGYWKMDEGEGKSIRDYARNRHMKMADETWYINNENKAVTLDGQSYLRFPTSESPYSPADDYAIEFWMRSDAQTEASHLLQAGEVSLWLDADGKLKLSNGYYKYNEAEPVSYNVGTLSLTDNAWHHIALNVLRQGAAAVYVDGERQLSISASNVGNIAAAYFFMGARRTSVSSGSDFFVDRHFKGQLDEIRVWDATLNANRLIKQRKVRLTGEEDGLVAYYPFETKTRDNFNQIVTVGTSADLTSNTHQIEMLSSAAGAAVQQPDFSDEAPALRTKPVEENVSFNFVASDTKVVIEIDENPATIEGCTLNLTVRDTRDENGNYSVPAVWSAFVNRKQLVWKDDVVAVKQHINTGSSVTATLVNKGSQQQMWTLSGMPSWISLTSNYGTTNPLAETDVTFNIDPAAPLGRHEVIVYVSDNDGIDVPLTINVKVTGDVPDWAVDPANFEETMNVIGSLQVLGIPSQDEDDIVAAFINGECRGVAHPEYRQRYDEYFITMDIYGNSSNSGNSGDSGDVNKPIIFKVYDASEGIIYPVVQTRMIDETMNYADANIVFKTNDMLGVYKKPVQLNATDQIEQNIEMAKGWNWMSLSVTPDEMTPSVVFANAEGLAESIKTQSSRTSYKSGAWVGLLTALDNAQMFLVKTNDKFTLNVTGQRVKPDEVNISFNSGWNWIAYNGQRVISLADALAELTPSDGDIIKGQRGVAYYDDYEWIGSLRTLVPGQGYKLKNTSAASTTFRYPASAANTSGARFAARKHDQNAVAEPMVFTPVDFHAYADNMVVFAQVTKDGTPLAGVELGFFADNECREAVVTDEQGMVFVTIPGDEPTKLTCRVTDGEHLMTFPETLEYRTDDVVGTPNNPFVLDISQATGIEDIKGLENETIYDIAGRKLNNSQRRTLHRGVYIINGQKTTVK